jgi:hypothetical protein
VAPDEETDVPDLMRAWRHKEPPPSEPRKRMIVAAPIIGSNPSAGFIVGAAAQVTLFRGDPSDTRLTSGIASLSISTKKQVLFNVRFDAFGDGNRWFVQGDNRFQSTAQDIYGFGTATPSSAALNTGYNFVRIQETVYHHAGGGVYFGGGFLFDSHSNVEPADPSNPAWTSSPYVTYSQQNGLPIDAQQSSGLSLNILLNRRDNDINARRGWRASARYRVSFDGFLGGDTRELDADARVYLPLSTRTPPHRALDLYQRRDERHRAVLRRARNRHGHLRPLRARLSGRTLPRRTARVRRGRIPSAPHAQRAPRPRRLHDHDDGVEPRDRRSALRLGCALRRRRPSSAAQ